MGIGDIVVHSPPPLTWCGIGEGAGGTVAAEVGSGALYVGVGAGLNVGIGVDVGTSLAVGTGTLVGGVIVDGFGKS